MLSRPPSTIEEEIKGIITAEIKIEYILSSASLSPSFSSFAVIEISHSQSELSSRI